MNNTQKIFTGLLSITFAGGICGQTYNRPNIVYVFPDQFRNNAMNFWNEDAFSKHVNFKADPVHTPNLDKFAKESVVFSRAQSNCPLSSPHRGMLLTGMYPDGNGVSLNCNSTRPCSNLNQDAVTISDVLSQNGYDCAYIGKLHVDYPTKNNPQNPGTYVEDKNPVWDAYTPPERRHGFNFWYSYGTFDEHKTPHYWDTNGERHEIREWSPKHEADKAIDYLQNVRDKSKPFFLMVSMNPPHSPYESLNDVEIEDYNLYKDTPLNNLLVRPNVNPELKKKQACAPFYFAAITGVDREFGRILSALKEMDLDKNTIVVFSSDHGETMASHVEDPKNSPYTEAMNVPFIVRYPEKLKPQISPLLLSTPDIMPTLLSLAGLNKQIPASVQGHDLSALIQKYNKSKSPKAVLYIQNVDGKKNPDGKVLNYFPFSRGIKTERYTLSITIDRKKNIKGINFFDDKKDPYQLNNLSTDTHRKEFQKLCRQLSVLLKDSNDPWYREKILNEIIPY
ncbi:MAG TPA: sulfatase [Paludibacteraceae bacterium]|nr:sulfatase [Paludibacteraceae bacterium]HPT43389.1 sulfatase [Paludibacteraceae bacterium]